MRWESTGFGFTEDVSVFVIVFGDSGEIDMFRGSGVTCGRVSIRDGNCKNSISWQAGEPSVSGCVYKRNRRDRRIFRSRRRIGIKRIKRIKSGGVRRHRRFRRAGRSRSQQRRFKRTVSPGASGARIRMQESSEVCYLTCGPINRRIVAVQPIMTKDKSGGGIQLGDIKLQMQNVIGRETDSNVDGPSNHGANRPVYKT